MAVQEQQHAPCHWWTFLLTTTGTNSKNMQTHGDKEDVTAWETKHFMDVDFMELGGGTTIKRQVWVANVEMAISVAKVVHDNFCTQETLWVFHTPQLKPSSNLPYRQTPNCPPSKQTGPTMLKQSGAITQRNSARSAHLSKSPYYNPCTHCSTPPLSEQTSHIPMLIHQPRNVRNKTQQQVLLMAIPNTDLWPYDKICAYLHRLHTRMKT